MDKVILRLGAAMSALGVLAALLLIAAPVAPASATSGLLSLEYSTAIVLSEDHSASVRMERKVSKTEIRRAYGEDGVETEREAFHLASSLWPESADTRSELIDDTEYVGFAIVGDSLTAERLPAALGEGLFGPSYSGVVVRVLTGERIEFSSGNPFPSYYGNRVSRPDSFYDEIASFSVTLPDVIGEAYGAAIDGSTATWDARSFRGDRFHAVEAFAHPEETASPNQTASPHVVAEEAGSGDAVDTGGLPLWAIVIGGVSVVVLAGAVVFLLLLLLNRRRRERTPVPAWPHPAMQGGWPEPGAPDLYAPPPSVPPDHRGADHRAPGYGPPPPAGPPPGGDGRNPYGQNPYGQNPYEPGPYG